MSHSALAKASPARPVRSIAAMTCARDPTKCSALAAGTHRPQLRCRQASQRGALRWVACPAQQKTRAQVPQLRLLRQTLEDALCWGAA